MQIRRFEHDPHAGLPPQGTHRSASGQSLNGSVSSNSTRIDQVSTKTDAGSPLSALTERLGSVQKVRSEIVAAARERVAAGLYETRESAEQLAASELRHDFF